MKKNTDTKEMVEIFKKEYKFIIFYFSLILIIFIILKIFVPPKLNLTYGVDIYPAVTENTIRELIFDMKKNSKKIEKEISKKLNKENKITVRDYAKNYRLFITVIINYEKRGETKNNLSNKNNVYEIIDFNIHKAFKKSFTAQKKQFEIENKAFEEDINLLNIEDSELKNKFLELSKFRSKENNYIINIVDNKLERDVYLIKENAQILDKINFKLLLSLIFASVFLSFLHISIIILKKNNF